MEILPPSTGEPSSPSIASAADSPASPSVSLADAVPSRTPDGSGPLSPMPFAYYDPATCSWKTPQASFLPEWERFSAIWPPAGTMRNGKAFPQPRLVPRISGNGSSLWPTPQAHDATGARSIHNTFSDNHHYPHDLVTAVRWWPTPRTKGLCGGTGAFEQMKALEKSGAITGAER